MIYIQNAIVVLLYGLLIKMVVPSRQTGNRCFVLIATLHVLLFHALRNPFIYPDNLTYAGAYEVIADYSLGELLIGGVGGYASWERGYVLFNYLLNLLTPSSETLFIASSVVIVGGFMWMVYKQSYAPLLSVLIFLLHPVLCPHSMFALRQHMAMAFVALMLCNMHRRPRAILFFLLAFSFHRSAIIILPFFFFYRLNLSRINFRNILLGGIAVQVVSRVFVLIAFRLFPHYQAYTEAENNVFPFVLLLSLFLMHVWNGSYKSVVEKGDETILRYLAYGVLMAFFTLGLPGGGRLSNYFVYIAPFTFPLLFKLNRARAFELKLFYSVFFFALIFLMDYMFFFQVTDVEKTGLNYMFFWEQE